MTIDITGFLMSRFFCLVIICYMSSIILRAMYLGESWYEKFKIYN